MLTSAQWINDYLDPPATPEEQAELATRAGFPLEGREEVELSSSTDVRQDFEMTSNRGDCVSHLGLAREIAAMSDRTLKVPVPKPTWGSTPAADLVTVTNHEPRRCPLYTARVIKGATVGPSPQWLQDRLIARGDIPRNNVVDATNFVLFEFGQPTHVFDLAKLKGSAILVRMAGDKEAFLPLGEGETEITLTADDLVIADAERAVALAGVKGGGVTAVTEATTDLLLEAASFDPVSVRNSSRRHVIMSESSYRFERGVHPGQVDVAADRLAELILELAGGELCSGVVADGRKIPERRRLSMRIDRCRRILGVPVTDEAMLDAFDRLGFEPQGYEGRIDCVVPVTRLDIEREIDLIEEVGRMFGHDNIPVSDTIEIRVQAPQPTELARQAVANELVGMGFVETVTHALVGEVDAKPFLPPGGSLLRVDDDRAKATPILQPSVLPGLLRVRRHNADNGVDRLRLFESAAAFWGVGLVHHERARLALVMDVDDEAKGLRPLRGVIERLATLLGGHDARLTVEADDDTTWLDPGATAHLDGTCIGRFGRLAGPAAERFRLDEPPLVAELELWSLYEAFPPETEAHALPTFPAIERDLSVIIDEATAWSDVASTVDRLDLAHREATVFVTTFRGKPIPEGKKSLTLRVRFRAPDRTLTHDEVDPQMSTMVNAMRDAFAADVRG